MSFDICMNDTCPNCSKPIKLVSIKPHAASIELVVHKFECADCGPVATKILFREQNDSAPELVA